MKEPVSPPGLLTQFNFLGNLWTCSQTAVICWYFKSIVVTNFMILEVVTARLLQRAPSFLQMTPKLLPESQSGFRHPSSCRPTCCVKNVGFKRVARSIKGRHSPPFPEETRKSSSTITILHYLKPWMVLFLLFLLLLLHWHRWGLHVFNFVE